MSDDDGSESNCSQRIRNVLTLEERVEVIRQYDILPMYSKLAKNFNCSWEQIKSIIANRDRVMEFYGATRINKKQPNSKFEELRRRKMNFLGHCLYEYIQRAQYHLHVDINEELIRTKALDFQALMGIDNFTPNKSWINHFKAAYNITFSNRQITMTRKPPRSLDLRDIMSYCGKNISTSDSNNQPANLPAPDATVESQVKSTVAESGNRILLAPRRPVDIRSMYRTKTLMAASSQNQATLDELQLRRKRKINFLEKALFEYIARSQFHHKSKGRLDVDHLREVAINLRDILKIENFFPDRTWFNHFKSHFNFSFSQGVQYGMLLRRVPLSLDLRDIVSYCSRHELREQAQSVSSTPKEMEFTPPIQLPMVKSMSEAVNNMAANEVKNEDANGPKTNGTDTNNAVEDDDDCVAIEEPMELIEIKDDDEEVDRANIDNTQSGHKRPPEESPTHSLPLKIQKIESLNPNAFSGNNCLISGTGSELPHCVESYKDALRLLKPLEEFALMEENYRAIGLLTQLEKIFQEAANQAPKNNAANGESSSVEVG